MAELWVTISNAPNKTNTTIMGIIHQSFRSHRNSTNSARIPIRSLTRSHQDMHVLLRLSHFLLGAAANCWYKPEGVYAREIEVHQLLFVSRKIQLFRKLGEIVIRGDIVAGVRNPCLGESRRDVVEIEGVGIGIVEKPQRKFVRNMTPSAAVRDVEIFFAKDSVRSPLRRGVFEYDIEDVIAEENVKNRGIRLENGSPVLVGGAIVIHRRRWFP